MGGELTGVTLGEHTVGVTLLDAAGRPLTRAARAAAGAPVAVTRAGVKVAVDFPAALFLPAARGRITGSYRFRLRYAGAACSRARPLPGGHVVRLTRGGKPVPGARVCRPGGVSCAAADGVDTGACWDGDLEIAGLPFGRYELRVRGVLPASDRVCFRGGTAGAETVGILVGAGTRNPVATLDLTRDPAAACARP